MDEAAWLGVKLYTQTQVLTGFIYHPYEQRLLDLLNGVWVGQLESGARFLSLSEVTIYYADGKEERLPTTYINKANIQLVAPLDSDSARGVGAKVEHKPYPYVEKQPLPVRLHLPGYSLTGSMHCASGERAWHVLEEPLMFLPLTNVKIHTLASGSRSEVPFVAVNREQILSLQEEGTPLLQVHRRPLESHG